MHVDVAVGNENFCVDASVYVFWCCVFDGEYIHKNYMCNFDVMYVVRIAMSFRELCIDCGKRVCMFGTRVFLSPSSVRCIHTEERSRALRVDIHGSHNDTVWCVYSHMLSWLWLSKWVFTEKWYWTSCKFNFL